MFTHDWSLVIFTILMQTAVGMLVVSELARFAAGDATGRQLSWQAPVACALSAIGLLVSMSHLGTPAHSVFTIFNAGDSWLSREILAVGGFFAATLLLVLLRRKNPTGSAALVSGVAMIIGLAAVFVMSKVYMLETIPVWNTGGTALGFYGTMLLAGAVAGGLLFNIQSGSVAKGPAATAAHGKMLAVFLGAAVLGLAFKFVGIPLDMAALSAADNHGVSGLGLLNSGGMGLLVFRLVLVFAGAALYGWGAFKALRSNEAGSFVAIGAFALAMVLAGEILGRLMFYGTYLRLGL
jgi:anaerobic dimethyl sulfoxide reductase subunit C (anchor subunit)